jgi:hypothetical protein
MSRDIDTAETITATLRKAPVGSLKAYYRTTLQIEADVERADEHESACEVRRWVTAELLTRLPRAEVVEFEFEVRGVEEDAPSPDDVVAAARYCEGRWH